MVDKQIQDDRGHQLAIMNLVHQYGDAIEAKDELQKAYEQCKDISMDKRAMINKFLKIESELEYEIQSALFKKAEKLEKQIRDKLEVDGGNVSSCTLLFTIPYPTCHSLKLLGFSKDKDGYFVLWWEGETVILGDFNKVQMEQERFGFVFNAQGANVFNNYYSMTNLIDLPLGGYSYTWSHKTATKMSKLDRFLISEGLLVLFPYLTGLCLDRHLSNHRPIVMYESFLDYGPTPFRMFHSWFKMEGFDKLLEKSWKSMNLIESNAMICLKKNFQLLKYTIKNWSKENKAMLNATKADVQKSYRRWIKFLIKTKKRSLLAICGILIDEDWIVDPKDLERVISYDEIKKRYGNVEIINLEVPMVSRLNSFVSFGALLIMMSRWQFLNPLLVVKIYLQARQDQNRKHERQEFNEND
nr:RNA-directed DNA polymerase, eukaryota [Tanacetum cinerariifolium]